MDTHAMHARTESLLRRAQRVVSRTPCLETARRAGDRWRTVGRLVADGGPVAPMLRSAPRPAHTESDPGPRPRRGNHGAVTPRLGWEGIIPDSGSGDRYRRTLPRSAANAAPADALPLPVVAPRARGGQPALQDPRQPRVPTGGSDPPRRTSLPVRLVNAPVIAAETAGLAEPVVAGEPAPHRALEASPAPTPDARAIRSRVEPGSNALQPRVRTRRTAATISVRAVALEAAPTGGSGTAGRPIGLDQTPSGQPVTVPPSSAGAAGRVTGPGTFGRPRAAGDAPPAETWSGPRERRRERREVAGGQSLMPRPAIQPRQAPAGHGVESLPVRRAELAHPLSDLPSDALGAAPELRGDDAPQQDDPVALAWSDDLLLLGDQLERLLRDEARRHGVVL